MLNYSSPWALRLRWAGQSLHVLRPAVRLARRISRSTYEHRFDRALFGHIRPGDTVWDIGANEGYYTRKIAEAVGSNGLVVAFEPSPRNVEKLNRQVNGLENVTVEQIAISDNAGSAKFFSSPGGDQTDGLSKRRADMEETTVLTQRADDMVLRYPPSVIKIDVEGFEPEVIRGMQETLGSAGLRAVFIEIHFLILRQRGLTSAPAEIADALRAARFGVKWTDSSHICAVRH